MSYQALYRKFRPDNLGDVKGQEAIVKTLSNQINMGRIAHAYLFCGTRGTGKTTVAKILARAVNCEHPTENGPCGECASCRAIAAGSSMNVIEIDAASNNGVDNVREIRDEVAYAPTDGKYKVYIIDEVHMLSGSAFNALLKTLEEPPAYVVFILATTEPHKLPATILSRCQRYDFKRIPMDTIVARMRELLDAEKLSAEDDALKYIARAADGGMRDALSILDQCLAFYPGKTISYRDVMEVLGAVDSTIFGDLFKALVDKDVGQSLMILDDVISNGRELTQFITDFTWHLRNILLASSSSEASEIPGIPGESLKELKDQAALTSGAQIIRYIRVLSELVNEIRFAAQKRVLAEIAIIKLCRPETDSSIENLNERLTRLEAGQFTSGNDAYNSACNTEAAPGYLGADVQSDGGYDEDPSGYVGGYEAMYADAMAGYPAGNTVNAAASGAIDARGGYGYGQAGNTVGGNGYSSDNSSYDRKEISEIIRRLEKVEQTLRNRLAAITSEGGMEEAPISKPELPAAIPADVEKVVQNFRAMIRDMDPIWKACIDKANLSLSKSGNLLMVFPNGDTGVGFCKRHKDDLEGFISERSGVKIHIEYEELSAGRDYDDVYVDLEKIIKMPIEIEN